MRSILDKRTNNKGQAIIVNMLFLVMSIMVLVAMIPAIKEMLNVARHQDSLNCKSNMNVCASNQAVPCYNSSLSSETTACLALDLYIPYVVIIVLVIGVAMLMANRVAGGFGQQPGYGGGYPMQ